MLRTLVTVTSPALILSCGDEDMKQYAKTSTSSAASCRPDPGSTYLAIGQDLFSIAEYLREQYNASLHEFAAAAAAKNLKNKRSVILNATDGRSNERTAGVMSVAITQYENNVWSLPYAVLSTFVCVCPFAVSHAFRFVAVACSESHQRRFISAGCQTYSSHASCNNTPRIILLLLLGTTRGIHGVHGHSGIARPVRARGLWERH